MSSKLDWSKVLKTYETLSKIPAVAGGFINNNNTVTSVWTQRNIEKGKTTKFLRTLILSPNNDLKKVSEVLPVDISNELLSAVSPSQNLKAILRDVENNQFLEIWENGNFKRNVDLNALDVHGSVYTDVEFATFEWSPDEKKIMYIAEKKAVKSEPFYKRAPKVEPKAGDVPKSKGEEHLFEQDWGEQLVGKKNSVIAQYDIENDEVKIIEGVPSDLCVAKPKYSPDGKLIVGVVYEVSPRKLGLIYCANRLSTIFQLDINNNTYSQYPITNQAVKSIRFTPDGQSVIWLQRKAGGPHAGAMSLFKAALPINEQTNAQEIVSIVKTQRQIKGGRTFYGLFNTGFTKRCWASVNRLILSTQQQNTIASYVINVDSGDITELEYSDGSLVVIDVNADNILAVKRNFFTPDKLVIGKLPNVGSESGIQWLELTNRGVVTGLEDKIYKYLTLSQEADTLKEFTAIYLGPKMGSDKSVPLILWPHGGPHSAFGNYLFLEETLFLSFNYAILLVNYRGSTGAGQDSVDFLPARVGDADVKDCILAVDSALKQFPWLNPNAVSLVGGSHGGFLVTHLSGQYPDRFKSVVARNPVTDIASMSIISDIPDWCYVEADNVEYSQKGPVDNEILLRMRQVSPIVHAHKVKAPTLLQIGSKDLRVPCYQGLDYFYRLKANGVTVRMNMYDDNHPLGTVPNELDNVINTMLWVDEHCT